MPRPPSIGSCDNDDDDDGTAGKPHFWSKVAPLKVNKGGVGKTTKRYRLAVMRYCSCAKTSRIKLCLLGAQNRLLPSTSALKVSVLCVETRESTRHPLSDRCRLALAAFAALQIDIFHTGSVWSKHPRLNY